MRGRDRRKPPPQPTPPGRFVGVDDTVGVDPVPGTAAGALLFGGLTILGRLVGQHLARVPQVET